MEEEDGKRDTPSLWFLERKTELHIQAPFTFSTSIRVYICIYIYIGESQTSLRAQFIAKRGEPPAGSQSEPVHGTRTDLLLLPSLSPFEQIVIIE